MVAMTRDPALETTYLPQTDKSRRITSVQWSYTSAGGALVLTSDELVPAGRACVPLWIEIDTEGTVPSTTYTMYLKFVSGSPYEGHVYLVDTWSGSTAEHHVVNPSGSPVPVPAGGYFELSLSASNVDEVINVHMIMELL